MFHPTLDPQLVGEVIAALRKKKGVSQEVLSGLADIGRTHLSAIERGERKPTLETLYRIACALDVPMSALVLDMEAEMARPPRVKRQNKSAHRLACAFAVPYGTEVYEKGEDECKVEGGKQKTMRYC